MSFGPCYNPILQALSILFGAFFTVAVATALGASLLRGECEDLALRFITGAAVVSLAVFSICAAQLAYPLVFAVLGAAALLVGPVRGLPWRRSLLRKVQYLPHNRLLLLAFIPFLILYFFSSMAPEASYDGSRYHLALVGRYLREHGFHPITNNMYASLSQGVEMLYLWAFAFGRHSAAAMVHFAFLLGEYKGARLYRLP